MTAFMFQSLQSLTICIHSDLSRLVSVVGFDGKSMFCRVTTQTPRNSWDEMRLDCALRVEVAKRKIQVERKDILTLD